MANGAIRTAVVSGVGKPLPASFAAVSLESEGSTATLSLNVLMHTAAKPAEGPLVMLREAIDSRTFLGCVLDAAGRVLRWVELIVQDVDGIASAPAAYRDALSNKTLDERWRLRCDTMDASGLSRVTLKTGWEDRHPAPLLVDVKKRRALRLVEKGSGGAWALCTDDALLARRGLPAYSTSLHRYLHVPAMADETFFVPVTRGAPANERTVTPEEAFGVGADIVPFNMGGGLMQVVEHEPVEFEEFLDLIEGSERRGDGTGMLLGEPSGPGLSTGLAGGLITSGRHGRLVETLCVKLRLLLDAASWVRGQVHATEAPMLNVSARSFGVRVSEEVVGLPQVWTARAVLRHGGEGVPISVAGGSARYYIGTGVAATVYAPAAAGQAGVAGVGTLRIREVNIDQNGVMIEARLASQERTVVSPTDLLWLRANIGGVRLDLYATPDVKKATATSEIALRTTRQPMGAREAQQVKGAEGVAIPGVMFESLPLASSPFDLYAIAVLAVRTLMVCKGRSLPVALDDMLSFATRVNEMEGGGTLVGRIRKMLEDKSDLDAVGPQHIRGEDWDGASALAVVTPELWCEVLAMIVRAIPGAGADSTCPDWGSPPAGALHRVFDTMIQDLRALVVKSRGLIVCDSGASREIRALVRRRAAGAGA